MEWRAVLWLARIPLKHGWLVLGVGKFQQGVKVVVYLFLSLHLYFILPQLYFSFIPLTRLVLVLTNSPKKHFLRTAFCDSHARPMPLGHFQVIVQPIESDSTWQTLWGSCEVARLRCDWPKAFSALSEIMWLQGPPNSFKLKLCNTTNYTGKNAMYQSKANKHSYLTNDITQKWNSVIILLQNYTFLCFW